MTKDSLLGPVRTTSPRKVISQYHNRDADVVHLELFDKKKKKASLFTILAMYILHEKTSSAAGANVMIIPQLDKVRLNAYCEEAIMDLHL